jgi:hypothetical protein
MQPINYKQLLDAQDFSDLMPKLFKLYCSYQPDTFSFDFLQRTSTSALKVVCKAAIVDKADFTTPPALEKAIQNSARINSPETSDFGPTADYSWAGWIGMTIDDLVDGLGISRGEEL